MSRKVHLIALALAAAAIAAPMAQAADRPDNRAGTLGVGSALASQPPLRPDDRPGIRGIGTSEPAGAVAIGQAGNGPRAQPKVDPLAVGYLTGKGLSPSEVAAWTVGACSHESKPAVCYSALERMTAPAQVIESENGFDWADAGIGAGSALGFGLLMAGLGAGFVIFRQNRRQRAHGM
jgi:hypothetical protein